MSKMKDKLHTGELYLPGDAEIMKEQVVGGRMAEL